MSLELIRAEKFHIVVPNVKVTPQYPIQRQIDADIMDFTVSASITVDRTTTSTPSLFAFKTLSTNNIKSLIHNSALKSCPLDPMPSRLVSKCDTLLPVVTMIKIESLEAGHFLER